MMETHFSNMCSNSSTIFSLPLSLSIYIYGQTDEQFREQFARYLEHKTDQFGYSVKGKPCLITFNFNVTDRYREQKMLVRNVCHKSEVTRDYCLCFTLLVTDV